MGASTFNKPPGLKYTDMAIYIDAHLADITESNENPEVEMHVYEYLYHIIYALAYKAGYFRHMEDYDLFALYGAGELFLSMKRKQTEAGTEKRGKIVEPIKSSLNYIKSVLFPLKINYQREHFAQVLNPELGYDTDGIIDNIKSSIQQQYSLPHKDYYDMAVNDVKAYLQKVLLETPFKNDRKMLLRIYFSVILTLINQLTLPNALKRKKEAMLKDSEELSKHLEEKITNSYVINDEPALLWHLDPSYDSYIKILASKVKKEFSKALDEFIAADELSDEVLTSIMYTAYENNNTKDSGDIE